jgi:hypothetical protein
MPEILDSELPYIEVKSFHHLLLPEAVSYDVHMDPKSNFFFSQELYGREKHIYQIHRCSAFPCAPGHGCQHR